MDFNSRILRELDLSESIFHVETEALSLINTRTILVKSSFDLFSRINLVENAIYEWKQKHHLLRCCIKQVESDTKRYKKRCFVYLPQEKINKSDNVEYLHFKSNSGDVVGDKYWQDLLENEFTRSLNCENELLWRLKLVKIETGSNDHYYRMIFTVHHGIVDGKNAFCLLQELLQIIEDLYLNKYKSETNNEITIPFKELFCRIIESNNSNSYSDVDQPEEEFISCKVPDYFKPSNIFTNEKSDVTIYRLDNTIYRQLSEILNENANKSNTKFVHFRIEDQTLIRLLEECRKHNLKLTGLISTVISIAIQFAYKYFSKNENLKEILHYFIAVNLRSHFKPPMDNYNVGNYATVFYSDSCVDNLCDKEEFWMNDFWRLAKTESDEIHKKLKEDDFIDCFDEEENFLIQLENGFQFSDFEKHFCLSNLGDMTEYASTKSQTFTIEDHYVFMSFRRSSGFYALFHGLVTINNCLYWSISYPCHLIKKEVIEYLVKSIERIINTITHC